MALFAFTQTFTSSDTRSSTLKHPTSSLLATAPFQHSTHRCATLPYRFPNHQQQERQRHGQRPERNSRADPGYVLFNRMRMCTHYADIREANAQMMVCRPAGSPPPVTLPSINSIATMVSPSNSSSICTPKNDKLDVVVFGLGQEFTAAIMLGITPAIEGASGNTPEAALRKLLLATCELLDGFMPKVGFAFKRAKVPTTHILFPGRQPPAQHPRWRSIRRRHHLGRAHAGPEEIALERT